jgi:hypothetical protein
MWLYGLDGADIISLAIFFYVSFKLYQMVKKESEDKRQ